MMMETAASTCMSSLHSSKGRKTACSLTRSTSQNTYRGASEGLNTLESTHDLIHRTGLDRTDRPLHPLPEGAEAALLPTGANLTLHQPCNGTGTTPQRKGGPLRAPALTRVGPALWREALTPLTAPVYGSQMTGVGALLGVAVAVGTERALDGLIHEGRGKNRQVDCREELVETTMIGRRRGA